MSGCLARAQSLSSVAVLLLLSAGVVAQPGAWSKYGSACGGYNNSLMYELFPPGTFQLNGSCPDWIQRGGNWEFSRSGLCFLPYGTELGAPTDRVRVTLGDDDVQGPFPLRRTFNYPGGSTNAIWIASNGYVYLQPNGHSPSAACCGGSSVLQHMTETAPIFALFGTDLDPSSGGEVWINHQNAPYEPPLGFPEPLTMITFGSVPEHGRPGSSNSAQLILFGSSAATAWRPADVVNHDIVVGWCGAVGPLNDPVDFSNSVSVQGGDGTTRPDLTLDSPGVPTAGQNFLWILDNVPPSATLGSLRFGGGTASLDLSIIGMERCTLLTSSNFASIPVPITFPTSAVSLFLPPQAFGLTVYNQATVLAVGTTTLGAINSNGGQLQIGN